MLRNWLKPKWQHPDPLTRLAAVGEQALDQSVLEQLAKRDPSLDVRRAALRRLNDLHLLVGLAAVSSPISDAAKVRVRFLLRAMGQEDRMDTALATEAITVCDDPGLTRELALGSNSSRLRRAAIGLLTEETALAQAAAEDESAEVRLAAARRVHSEESLKGLEKAVRNRDKRIAQLARQRLTELREASERAAERDTLIRELESLGRGSSWPGDDAAWLRIRARWPQIAQDAEPSQLTRFQRAESDFEGLLDTYRAAQTHGREIARHRRSLLDELDALARRIPDSEPEDSRLRLREIESAWALLPAAAEAVSDEDDFQHRLLQTRDAIEQSVIRSHLRTNLDRLESEALALRGQTRPDSRLVARLCQELNDLPQTLPASLEPRRRALTHSLDALSQALDRQAERDREREEEIQWALDTLEQALDQGQLDPALHAHKKASDLLHSLQGLESRRRGTLETRLRAAGPRLAELKSWRHWGSDRAREELIGRAVALVDSGLPPARLAKEVKALREEWKRLGHLDPGGKLLWERFDSACTRAIQPALAQRREAAAARKDHLERRAEVCAALERLNAETDWQGPDWRHLDKSIHRLRRDWRTCGPVVRHDWQVVKARYDEAIAALEAHMEGERRHNRLHREGLTQEAESLLQSPDLHEAVAGARALRESWQVTVSSPPREEKRLWKRFHEAIEAVLERERQERQAHRRALDENLSRFQALCDELNALCQGDDASVLGCQRQAQRLIREAESHGPFPPRTQSGAEARIQRVRKAFAERVAHAERAGEDRRMQTLKAYSALCTRLEQAALRDQASAELLEEVDRAWNALPPLDEPEARECLYKRLDLAKRLAAEPAVCAGLAHTLQSNLEHWRSLCLDLEILLGKDSPETERGSRLQRQVSLLSQAMTQGRREESSEKRGRLMRELLLCGPVPPGESESLRARLEQLE